MPEQRKHALKGPLKQVGQLLAPNKQAGGSTTLMKPHEIKTQNNQQDRKEERENLIILFFKLFCNLGPLRWLETQVK